MKRRYYVLLAVAASLVAIGIGTACSNQGEGEVCNFANGSDDCQTGNGLACYPANLLNNVTSDRCCPTDRTKSTHPACIVPTVVTGSGDATAPSNTGPNPTTQDAEVADSGSNEQADAADAADAQDQ